MEIQGSLFESAREEQGSVPICKEIGPIPLVQKEVVKILENVPEIQHKEEVDLLMKATRYRTRNNEAIAVSKTLVGASKKFRVSVSDVVVGALKTLEEMPNLYAVQAIFMSLNEPIYGFAIK